MGYSCEFGRSWPATDLKKFSSRRNSPARSLADEFLPRKPEPGHWSIFQDSQHILSAETRTKLPMGTIRRNEGNADTIIYSGDALVQVAIFFTRIGKKFYANAPSSHRKIVQLALYQTQPPSGTQVANSPCRNSAV